MGIGKIFERRFTIICFAQGMYLSIIILSTCTFSFIFVFARFCHEKLIVRLFRFLSFLNIYFSFRVFIQF